MSWIQILKIVVVIVAVLFGSAIKRAWNRASDREPERLGGRLVLRWTRPAKWYQRFGVLACLGFGVWSLYGYSFGVRSGLPAVLDGIVVVCTLAAFFGALAIWQVSTRRFELDAKRIVGWSFIYGKRAIEWDEVASVRFRMATNAIQLRDIHGETISINIQMPGHRAVMEVLEERCPELSREAVAEYWRYREFDRQIWE